VPSGSDLCVIRHRPTRACALRMSQQKICRKTHDAKMHYFVLTSITQTANMSARREDVHCIIHRVRKKGTDSILAVTLKI